MNLRPDGRSSQQPPPGGGLLLNVARPSARLRTFSQINRAAIGGPQPGGGGGPQLLAVVCALRRLQPKLEFAKVPFFMPGYRPGTCRTPPGSQRRTFYSAISQTNKRI